jgi:outer membrane protein assembly factor BamB
MRPLPPPALWLVLAVATLSRAVGAEDWPAFRGPGATGVASATGLPDRWSATENVAWKTDLPGRGWSSPVVVGGRVFLTTCESSAPPEEAKKGLYFGGDRSEPSADVHRWKAMALDLESGRVLWEKVLHEGPPTQPIHIKGSHASETPVADGSHLWCLFGGVGIFCLDHAGELVWERPLPARRMRAGWGTAASPALHGGRLYVVSDNEEASEIVALDAGTGDEVWKTERDEKSNWSTPFVWETPTRTEIVTAGTGKVRSYSTDGTLLWWLEGMSAITIATPYAQGGLLYVSSGYVMDRKKPLYAIRPGAAGDITPTTGSAEAASVAWSLPSAAPYNPTTLAADGRVHVLHDRGFLAAYAAADGRELYAPTRIPDGRAFTASPWAADGKIFCLNEDGVTFVFRAGDSFEPLHANPLAEDDMAMATPALAGDRLLIRTSARLYCIRRPR